jgi:hypothetical protein
MYLYSCDDSLGKGNKLKDTAQGRLQTVVRYVEKRWISSRIRIYPITIWCVSSHPDNIPLNEGAGRYLVLCVLIP